ncbi:hypothetical protein HD806DRAFT_546190 [Xylariaceae sp. AK1471]|nr:hypothetical protein HD806DRAFT_546190 [Xylariaceae sp. AK1471]
MPPIFSLPFEVSAKIASDEGLKRDDLAAMRLACTLFTAPVASTLFRRVIIPRLTKDRDSLEHIAANKHFAQHVRELIWHELDLEVWIWSEPASADLTYTHNLPFDDYEHIRLLMAEAALNTNLFWIPRIPYRGYLEIVPSSLNWFLSTVGRFPNLTAFLTCPMPENRSFIHKGYRIQVDLYRQSVRVRGGNDSFFTYSE